MKPRLLLLIYSNCIFTGCAVAVSCPPLPGESTSHVIDYVFVSEENYDRNISSLEDGRPLGYALATWVYNDETQPNPCIRVSGSTGRAVEVMVETSPPQRLCVRSALSNENNNFNTINQCRENKFKALCRRSIATEQYPDLYYEFYCDQACSESDVFFYYRITLSENVLGEAEGWCDSRKMDFPSSLYNNNRPPPHIATTTPPDNNSAAYSSLPTILTVCSSLFFTLLV